MGPQQVESSWHFSLGDSGTSFLVCNGLGESTGMIAPEVN